MSTNNWEPFMAWEGIEGSIDKNGLENINLSYYVPTLALARLFVPADIVQGIGLPVMRRTYKQEWGNEQLSKVGAGEAYKLTLGLEGMQNPADGENGVQFTSDATLAQDPPDASPNWELVKLRYHGGEDADRIYGFPETIIVDGKEIPNPAYGLRKWWNPGVTWHKTYLTLSPPPSLTYMLGKIDTPPPAQDGYIPYLPGKRNWLKIVGQADWRGNIWKVTEAWEMSGDGGWLPELYR